MAEMEMKGRKKRLPINLSFLTLADSKKKQAIARKSPRNFHDPIAGVGVGLGILAALNNQDLTYNRNAVLVMSPKSATSPISIYRNMNSPQDKKLCVDKMAFCEEYTCVISHVGKNIIKKREYFEADILVNDDEQPAVLTGDAAAAADPPVETANFLSSCFLCKKMLHGLDVFIYRGDKAFCSEECRCRQISIDEQKEKCRTGLAMPMGEYPASSCSVAAA